MSHEVVILEDCRERQAKMEACLSRHLPQFSVRFFEAAQPMIAHLERCLKLAVAIVLDHDLEFLPNECGIIRDPGTGRDVADYLATRTSVCPVVIHSTNAPAAVGMKMALDEANWTTFRVVPYGDLEWVSEVWIQAMRRAIVDTAESDSKVTSG